MMTGLSAPLLSICIPTYNRSGFLREALDSIIASASSCLPEVEIIVSDNASPDDTPAIMADYQARYAWIRYHRNETNIGGERNFYQVAGMASGEHLWIFSDDDKMTLDAIPTMLDYVRAGHRLIVTNYSIWSRDFSFVKIPNRCGIKHNTLFNNPDELLKRLGEKVTLISSVVMDKTLFFSVDASKRDPFIQYGHGVMYIVYAVAAQCGRIAYHGTPLVQCRGDNSIISPEQWDNVFIVGPALTFDALAACGYSPQAIHAAKNSVLTDLIFKAILYRKREGISTRGLYKIILPYYWDHLSFWLMCVPALLVPKFVPRLMTQIIRVARPILYRQVH